MGEVFFTVLAGVLIYVGGQFAMKLFVEPILDIRHAVGRIAYGLRFHANRLSNAQLIDPNEWRETSDFWRDMAARCDELTHGIILHPVWSGLRLVPSRKALEESSKQMIGLSNSFSADPSSTRERSEAIRHLLAIREM